MRHAISLARFAICGVLAIGGHGLTAKQAEAYTLYQSQRCNPGLGWGTANTIQVRLLNDSLSAYLDRLDGVDRAAATAAIDADIRAVVDLYNAMPGVGYTLQYRPEGFDGDSDLGGTDSDNFGYGVIAIGFTQFTHANSPGAEAWAQVDEFESSCTIVRSHIRFRMTDTIYQEDPVTGEDEFVRYQPFQWVFGPPDSWRDADRDFYTAAQPRPSYNVTPISFLGILTHEFGHAMGLSHPLNDYAIMAQSTKTWLRGPDHSIRVGLLPDDIAGLRALYGSGNADYLDLSASHTWVKTKADKLDRCADLQAATDAAEDALSNAFAGNASPAVIGALLESYSQALSASEACDEDLNASQIRICTASARGTGWAEQLDGAVPCGLTGTREMGDRICPGDQVQVRYTLNNHSPTRDLTARVELWLSEDEVFAPNRRPDRRLQSVDIRDSEVGALRSKSIGQVFRLPENAVDGMTYNVFVRARPHDPGTGGGLWGQDAHQWNNSTLIPGQITVDSGACS